VADDACYSLVEVSSESSSSLLCDVSFGEDSVTLTFLLCLQHEHETGEFMRQYEAIQQEQALPVGALPAKPIPVPDEPIPVADTRIKVALDELREP
jgi:hypothetical protein